MAEGLTKAGYACVERPLADGGEGTLDVLLAARGGTRMCDRATGPLGLPVEAEWALLDDGTAIVETARVAGLQLVTGANDAVRATSRGVGELIAIAIGRGATSVLVAAGGSATTDGGLGALQALEWSLDGHPVTVLCDVETRFADAARVFGPQKGASATDIAALSARLDRLAAEYQQRLGVDVTALPSGGAAGGLGGGLAALGARLTSGFDCVAATVGLQAALDAADLIVTGEGRLDPSSLVGKVVGEVLMRAPTGAALAVIAGSASPGVRAEVDARVRVEVLADGHASSEAEAVRDARRLVRAAAQQLGAAIPSPLCPGELRDARGALP